LPTVTDRTAANAVGRVRISLLMIQSFPDAGGGLYAVIVRSRASVHAFSSGPPGMIGWSSPTLPPRLTVGMGVIVQR